MEKDAAGYPKGHTNPGTSRTSPAAYPTSRAVLRGEGGGDVTSLPDAWVGNHPSLPGAGTVMLLLGPPVRTKRHVQAHQQTVPDTFEPL